MSDKDDWGKLDSVRETPPFLDRVAVAKDFRRAVGRWFRQNKLLFDKPDWCALQRWYRGFRKRGGLSALLEVQSREGIPPDIGSELTIQGEPRRVLFRLGEKTEEVLEILTTYRLADPAVSDEYEEREGYRKKVGLLQKKKRKALVARWGKTAKEIETLAPWLGRDAQVIADRIRSMAPQVSVVQLLGGRPVLRGLVKSAGLELMNLLGDKKSDLPWTIAGKLMYATFHPDSWWEREKVGKVLRNLIEDPVHFHQDYPVTVKWEKRGKRGKQLVVTYHDEDKKSVRQYRLRGVSITDRGKVGPGEKPSRESRCELVTEIKKPKKKTKNRELRG